MGVSRRKDKEKQIRKDDIIDAAEKIFFLKGYDVATMDDIAKEAEFSKRTVYIYFNSKEQLYFEIMVRGYKILIEAIEDSLDNIKEKNSLDRLKQIGKTFFDFNNEYPDYFNAIMSYENGEKDFASGISDESREECYALGEKIFGYLSSALADGIEEGVIRDEIDIIDTAIVIWSFTLGLFNTLIKKRNYIEHYHKRDSQKLLLEGLDMLMMTISNKNGGKENEKEE
jgi:AcrR family transcriptional regulator